MAFSEKENRNKIDTDKAPLTSEKTGQPPARKVEKRVLIFLVILFLLVVPFSVWQLNRQLKSPFIKNPGQNTNNNAVSLVNNEEAPVRIEALRQKDTDGDGLTDYDELYIYKTSPYLKDSDSDEIADNVEITQNTDPNCPKGENCSRTATNANANGTGNVNAVNAKGNTTALDVNNLTPDQLRQIMRDAGASETLLNGITDADLLQTYRDILATEGTSLNANVGAANSNAKNQNTSLSTLDYNALFNLNASDIRQLLIEGGAPKDTLDQVDDATLVQIYQDSLTQNLSQGSTNANAAP